MLWWIGAGQNQMAIAVEDVILSLDASRDTAAPDKQESRASKHCTKHKHTVPQAGLCSDRPQCTDIRHTFILPGETSGLAAIMAV